MVNNIRNNTISDISAKKNLNKLNDIKNAEIIKYKKRTTKQKELLNLFNYLLDVILTDETLISSKDKKENENDKTLITIKGLNDDLDEIIDKSKSFEDQIKLIRKVENLEEYWHSDDFGDKELKFKYFQLKLAHLAYIIDEKLFEQIFGHKFETLANKLINTTNKEENQLIVKNIDKNK